MFFLLALPGQAGQSGRRNQQIFTDFPDGNPKSGFYTTLYVRKVGMRMIN